MQVRLPRLSEGLILHVRQHEIVWKYIYKYTAEAREQNFGSKGSAEVWRHTFTSLQMKAARKCGKSGTSDLWQSRQSGNAEAKLHIFGRPGRDELCGIVNPHPCE